MENLFLIAKVKNFVREKQSSMRKLTTIITGVILLEIFSSNLWELMFSGTISWIDGEIH